MKQHRAGRVDADVQPFGYARQCKRASLQQKVDHLGGRAPALSHDPEIK